MNNPDVNAAPDPGSFDPEPDQAPDAALKLIKPPPHLWAIWIAEDAAIYSRMKRPNAFRRFWTWAFFGWRWTPVEKGQTE